MGKLRYHPPLTPPYYSVINFIYSVMSNTTSKIQEDDTVIGTGVTEVTDQILKFVGDATAPKDTTKSWWNRRCEPVDYEGKTYSRIFAPKEALVDGAKLVISQIAPASGSGKAAVPAVWIATVA